VSLNAGTSMNAPDINCPNCGTPMVAGTAYVRGTVLGFLAFGRSYQHLWFQSETSKEKIVESGGDRPAHRCPKCGAVTIYTRRDEGSS